MRVSDVDTSVLLEGIKNRSGLRLSSTIVRVIEVTDVCKVPHFNDDKWWIIFNYESSDPIFFSSTTQPIILSGWVLLDDYNRWNLPNQRDKILNELI